MAKEWKSSARAKRHGAATDGRLIDVGGGIATPKLALFLGSGASAFAGYRTFETFPDLLFNDIARSQEGLPGMVPLVRELLHDIDKALRTMNKATTHDNFLLALSDYRKLWRSLRVDNVLRSRFLASTTAWGTFAHFSRLAEEATDAIMATTIWHYSRNRVVGAVKRRDMVSEEMRRVFDFYIRLASFNGRLSPCLAVFTTNYDMLVEDLFSQFGGGKNAPHLVTGFDSRQKTRAPCWDAARYYRQPGHRGAVYLHRIHGCVCWFSNGPDASQVRLQRQKCLDQDHRQLCAVMPGRESGNESDPLVHSLRAFYRILLNCVSAVFIGFSFRDDRIAQVLLAANAQRETPIRLIVADAATSQLDVIKRLEKASMKTPLPARICDARELELVDTDFGRGKYDDRIVGAVEKALSKRRSK